MQILTQKKQSLSTKINNDNDLKKLQGSHRHCQMYHPASSDSLTVTIFACWKKLTHQLFIQAFVLTIDIGHLDC